ncbi:hypothetical protein [Elstera litoralis]|uniref:hypothetical protein n=1 Tax=Elstera litoralis TaxID=552518 RepID=UPI0012ED1A70|nr:hypothetical protein [Elstera litoralis]
MTMKLVIDPSSDRPFSDARWVKVDEPDTVASAAEVQAEAKADGKTTDDGLTFADVLDTINPLQHLPIIGTIYRELTGSTLSPAARIIGGGLYGGPIGVVLSMVDATIQEGTGRDIGSNVLAMVKGDPLGKEAVENIAKAKDLDAKRPQLAEAKAAVAAPAPIVTAQLAAETPAPAALAPAATPTIAAQAATLPNENGRIALTSKGPMGGVGGPTAAMPAGSTGFIGKSNIPSGGMITPAAAMMNVQGQGAVAPAQLQPGQGVPGQTAADPTQSMTGFAGVAALQAQRSAPQAVPVAPSTLEAAAATTVADAPQEAGWFKVPERTARSATRTPPVLERREVNNTLANKPSVPNPAAVQAAETAARVPPTGGDAQILSSGAPSISDAMARALSKYDALVKTRTKPAGAVDEAY